ncbi:MAG: hypothetical protein C0616_03300 [Desulfuromonas sp.]|nr:MAG: hypothetical protein C0616_03300 [Desulfuromonas sp.]
MRLLLALCVVGFLLGGCAAPTEEMKKLQLQNSNLQGELAAAKESISELEQQKADLTGQVEQLTRISGTLEREKAVRVEETGQLRQGVRSFVRSQLSSLREFSKNEDFLDYSGGELIERSGSPGKSVSLVDTQNTMGYNGTLYGIRGQFSGPVALRLAVLRPIKQRWVVVWNTEKLEVKKPGLQQVDFPVPVSVEAGDLVAYQFPDEMPVACDKGTGGLLMIDQQLESGQKLQQQQVGSFQGYACSIGVVGILGE